MAFFNNEVKLFGAAFGLFTLLTLFVAINPALENQRNSQPLRSYEPLTEEQVRGKEIYISNGCVACHTQQVRNVEMDRVWGGRPGIPADYAANKRVSIWQNTATLMGTERTGPDLTNIGDRQPSLAWNLIHLYQPRAVVEASIMPAYPWLFEEVDSVYEGQTEVNVSDEFKKNKNKKIIATRDALDLVAYLQSLKQASLMTNQEPAEFLYPIENTESSAGSDLPDGKILYENNCQACHQPNGEGLPGAFPSLKGSPIVVGDDLELFVSIIMKGYDARPEYAVMNAVGTDNNLSAEEVTAIINHERTSWGNDAEPVTLEEVESILNYIQ